jgi:hypothetical protein
MEIRSDTCWVDPLHFQFPPTKNLRASSLEDELKALYDGFDGTYVVC